MEKNNICSKCGAELESKANFCSVCGKPLNAMAKELRNLEVENSELILLGNLLTMLKNKQDIQMIKDLALEIKNRK